MALVFVSGFRSGRKDCVKRTQRVSSLVHEQFHPFSDSVAILVTNKATFVRRTQTRNSQDSVYDVIINIYKRNRMKCFVKCELCNPKG